MKTIIFNKLEISNFKGIEKTTIQFDNQTALRGANGTGKTTVADAAWWVLFNKDSNGASDFPVKRKDKNGNDIHNIIVDVTLDLSINGVRHIFRRTQEENWVTKRGSTEQVMEGNVQSLFYNESKLKSKEYAEAVNAIVDEESFKLLTNPMFFMTQIDYKKRREILMRLVGNDKDIENAIRSKSEYYLLDTEWKKDLNINKVFGQFFETMKQKAKQNQDEIDRLPYQVDELKRTIVNMQDEVTIKTLIQAYTKELNDLTAVKVVPVNQKVIEAESELHRLQNEYASINESANNKALAKRSEIALARQNLNFSIGSSESKIALLKNQVAFSQQFIDREKAKRIELLDEYKRVEAQVWETPTVQTSCPTCGQALPDLNVDKVMADHKLHFEQDKQKKLESIVEQGKEVAALIAKVQQEITSDQAKITELEALIESEKMKLEGYPVAESINANQFVDQNTVTELQGKIKALKDDIQQQYDAMKNNQPDTTQNNIRIAELKALISDNNQRLGAIGVQKETLKRIDELTQRESVLIAEKNQYKTLVFQCEQFEREKNEAIEQQLSSHFNRIKWRLFKQQVNGGYQQVCDPLLDGRPYDAQSTGERIFTGCDIIKCFQNVYETEAPVLIDNRESLTLALPLTSQTISMYADDRYSNLTQV